MEDYQQRAKMQAEINDARDRVVEAALLWFKVEGKHYGDPIESHDCELWAAVEAFNTLTAKAKEGSDAKNSKG